MPRTVFAGLLASMGSSGWSPAVLVRLTRPDGLVLGFTDADVPITFGGVTYDPSPGLRASEIEQTASSSVDSLDVSGALTSDKITEADVVAGLYAGSRILVQLVDRDDLSKGAMVLQAAVVGEVRSQSGEFRAECRGLTSLLKQQAGELTSKTCPVRRLGDSRCKFDLAGNTVGGRAARATRTVASSTGDSVTLSSESAPSGYYSGGILKMTSGPNNGLEREVKRHTLSSGTAVLELRTPFPFAVSAGQSALVEVGCDRRFETCRDKFDNARNFRGQPHMPGNDQAQKRGRPPQ